MQRISSRSHAFYSRFVTHVAFLMTALWGSTSVHAQDEVVRIEEHWELLIAQADSQTNSPQIMMHFSPFGNDNEWHFEVDINHASLPQYQPGGFQVRAMQGSQVANDVRLLHDNRLASQYEFLEWVQIAQKQPTGWAFGIGYGNSTSWGSFGGPSTVVTIPDNNLPLKYSPTESLQNSGVLYARNRVERLTLKKVRYYFSNNQMVDVPVGQSVQ